MKWLCVSGFLFLSSCSYHFVSSDKQPVSLMIPFIEGDYDSILQTELTHALISAGGFTVHPTKGEFTLHVAIESDGVERVGFRYDRDNPEGDLEKNLLGVENRRSIKARVSLIRSVNGKEIFPSEVVKAFVVYDYTDPGSPRDLIFSQKQPVMQFSLGQLDSFEGAYDSASLRLFKNLAEQIARGLSNCSLKDIES